MKIHRQSTHAEFILRALGRVRFICLPLRKARNLLPIFFLFSLPCFGQAWSGVLSSNRAIDWSNAGLPTNLPDGETTPNPWTPPTRLACTSAQAGTTVPIPSSASVSTINSAIAACASANPNGSYLLLGSGTFAINSTVILYGVNDITLRGSGPMSTVLSLTSGDYIAIGEYPSGGTGAFLANYSAGTTSITIGSISGSAPTAGSVGYITQCDTGSGAQPCSTAPSDNGSLFICGDYNSCQTGSNTTSSYVHQEQAVLITNSVKNGNGTYTLTISPGLYMANWTTASGAEVTWNSSSNQVNGIGLEDMTIYSPTNSQNFIIEAQNSYASWLKGLRIIGSGASFSLKVTNSKNYVIVNNYCASQIALSSYHACYSVDCSSDVLVLNNIASNGIPTEYDGRNVGVVTAYNFGRDAFIPYAENEWSFDHHAFSSFDLYEGNESGGMTEDNIWGTHALNTYFRNYIIGYDAPYVGGSINARGLVIDNYQRFENAIGNVIGSVKITAYQGTGFNAAFQISTGDSQVASTLMRWGNVTNIQQSSDTPANSGVRFVSSEVPTSLSSLNTAWQNSVPSNDSLPCSFFLPTFTSTTCTAHPSGGTGLSWWKVCTTWTTFPTGCSATQTQPFPTAGPDVTNGPYVNGYAYDIPAAIAWRNLPVDTTYQNSYTITASSWSNGTETLTVSGLPNYNCGDSAPCDVLGAFQLSGVNSACTNGATFGNNSEILITNTSSTTVSYALASNPSVSCTGTMKFPDIRQFDERVYEDDPGGTSDPPNPPSSVKAALD
jgi:hypothetical protein